MRLVLITDYQGQNMETLKRHGSERCIGVYYKLLEVVRKVFNRKYEVSQGTQTNGDIKLRNPTSCKL